MWSRYCIAKAGEPDFLEAKAHRGCDSRRRRRRLRNCDRFVGVGNTRAAPCASGPRSRRGLENRWDPADSIRRDDHFLLVDRAALAGTLLAEAQRRGAVVEDISTAPTISQSRRGVIVTTMQKSREFDYAIDATGRAAVWSRPVKRVRHLIADIFEASSTHQVPALTLRRYGMRWA